MLTMSLTLTSAVTPGGPAQPGDPSHRSRTTLLGSEETPPRRVPSSPCRDCDPTNDDEVPYAVVHTQGGDVLVARGDAVAAASSRGWSEAVKNEGVGNVGNVVDRAGADASKDAERGDPDAHLVVALDPAARGGVSPLNLSTSSLCVAPRGPLLLRLPSGVSPFHFSSPPSRFPRFLPLT